MRSKADISAKLEEVFKLIRKGDEIKEALNGKSGFPGADLVKASGKKNGDYLVTVAARHGRIDVLSFLKDEYAASFEVANHDGKRPIHEAAQHGHVQCVSYLIQAGVDVDALKRATWTPLMLACTKQNLDVIRVLIERGGATYDDFTNKDGWTCFHIACREASEEILRYLLGLGPKLWRTRSNVQRTPLHTASLNGNVGAVRLLLKAVDSERINCRDVCGATPLTDAIRGGHASIVTSLLEALSPALSSILSELDSVGRHPLDVAAMVGNLDIFVIALKATVLASSETAAPDDLAFSRDSSSFPTVEANLVLRRRNGDRGRTPLHYAALEGREKVVEWIVTRLRAENVKNEAILIADDDGKSPADLASLGRHRRCVDMLRGCFE